jgi:hypothetical protein
MQRDELQAPFRGPSPIGPAVELEIAPPSTAGRIQVPGLEVEPGEVEDGVGVVRIARDRLAELPARRVRTPAVGDQSGEVEPGLDEGGIALERAAIVLLGFLDSAQGAQAVGAIERGDRVAGIEIEAAPVEVGRLGQVARFLSRLRSGKGGLRVSANGGLILAEGSATVSHDPKSIPLTAC